MSNGGNSYREVMVEVLEANLVKSGQHEKLRLKLAEENPQDGSVFEYEASCPVWHGFLWDELTALAGARKPVKMTIKEGEVIKNTITEENPEGYRFQDVVAVDGVEKPADWDERLEKMGFKSNRGAGGGQGGAGGSSGGQPSPVATRVQICQIVNKLVECGVAQGKNPVEAEAIWDAWYWKIECRVFRNQRVLVSQYKGGK